MSPLPSLDIIFAITGTFAVAGAAIIPTLQLSNQYLYVFVAEFELQTRLIMQYYLVSTS